MRIPLLLVVWLWLFPAWSADLEVRFLDVGQGDAAVAFTEDGNDLVIDAGPPGAGPKIFKLLKRNGAISIDFFILTHPHMDHIGGLPYLMRKFPLLVLVDPSIPHTIGTYKNVMEAFGERVEKHIGKYIRGAAGEKISIGHGVDFEMLWPPEDKVKKLSVNESSIVGKLVFGGTCFLFMGDAGALAEKKLLDSGAHVKCGVLKVGHHGSRGSTTKKFIDAVKPQYAVISVGEDNPYGHPSSEVVERLVEAGAVVLSTAQGRTISFTSDGGSIKLTKK